MRKIAYLALVGVILVVAAGVVGCSTTPTAAMTNPAKAASNSLTIGGCPILPANNVWNTRVDNLPVDPNSSAYIASIGTNTGLHPDFGSGLYNNAPIGIPYTTVPSNQPGVNVTFDINDESDPGPYPIPPNAPVEGDVNDPTGDHHVIVVQQGTCKLYEMWASAKNPDNSWNAGSGAIFDLNSNALRPNTWTSADAAGLPILPGLARYDEVQAGAINHALRFTVQNSRTSFIWPARHEAGKNSSSSYPPMGQRFRLKSSFNISGFPSQVQVILTAMKTYGIILADNGSNWYISGAPDPGWDNDFLAKLGQVKGSDFEAIDESSLQLDPNSGQVLILNKPASPGATAVSSSQINLNWGDTSTSESGFRVERSLGTTGSFSTLVNTGPNATSYQNTGLTDGTLYNYRISAFYGSRFSPLAGPVSAITPMLAPSGLTAQPLSSSQVSLSWTNNSASATSFLVERSVGGGAYVAVSSPNTASFVDTNLLENTAYSYRVRAVNNVTSSATSNIGSTTTLIAPPSGLVAVASASNQIRLFWSDNSSGEDGYNLERTATAGNWSSPTVQAVGANTTTFTDTTVVSGTTYYYRLRGSKGSYNTAYTNEASALPSGVWMVTQTTDNNDISVQNSFAWALDGAKNSSNKIIVLAPTTGNAVTLNVTVPSIPPNITILGACGTTGPTIQLQGQSAVTGLTLSGGTTFYGVEIFGFTGPQLHVPGGLNQLRCVKVR